MDFRLLYLSPLCAMQRTRTAVKSVNALIQPVMPQVNILTPQTRLRVSTFFAQGTLQPNIHIQPVKPARIMSPR